MSTKLTFREAQLGAYNILKFIDQLCNEHGLTYFLMYGSLIGAVRDHGIIPWDDDIDVIMPRPDYDKLLELFESSSFGYYKLFEHSLISEYPHPIARMSDMRYKVDFDNEKDYGIGLFVDIYPLDGVGNDAKVASELIKESKRLSSLCFLTSRKRFGKDNTNSILKMVIKIPAYIWANTLGNDHYIKKIDECCRTYDYNNSKYVSCVSQPFNEADGTNRNVWEKEWFAPIKVAFEDGYFVIPSGFHELLTLGYNDYMTPLSESQRQTHHTYDTYRID